MKQKTALQGLTTELTLGAWRGNGRARTTLVIGLQRYVQCESAWVTRALDDALDALYVLAERAPQFAREQRLREDLIGTVEGTTRPPVETWEIIQARLSAISRFVNEVEPSPELGSSWIVLGCWFVAKAERPYRAESKIAFVGNALFSGLLKGARRGTAPFTESGLARVMADYAEVRAVAQECAKSGQRVSLVALDALGAPVFEQ